MRKNLLSRPGVGLVMLGGVAQFASADPVLMGSATWIDGGVKHEYSLYSYSGMSWDAANTWTMSNLPDYYLASITSAAEESFVNTNVFGGQNGEYWLGGYQNPISTPVATANWVWVSGDAWSYSDWAGGEPNDYYGPGSEQYLGGNWGGLKQWNDEGALGNVSGFVVEKTVSVPEPSTVSLLALGLGCMAGFVGVRRKK